MTKSQDPNSSIQDILKKRIRNKYWFQKIQLVKKNQLSKVLKRDDSSISAYDDTKLREELGRMVREEQ